MGVGAITKRRRTGTDSSLNSATPSRPKSGTGRGRGRPPNAPRDGRERPPSLAECFKRRCNDVLDRLSKKDHYNIFLEPVNTNDVAGYLDVIKQPMDFTTMRAKLSQQVYKSLGEFRKDLDLIWSNCLLFNGKEPTNVFSKKAIELRRLTEKLIVNTRRDLERDKEILHQWKEKHRKRRETMAAKVANAAAKRHGGPLVIPTSSVASRDHRTDLGNDGRDPMLSTEYSPQDHNGRSPEQTALAESLRLQYSGTTGLFKRGMQSAPYPQYTKPDGSIVHIPVIRYNPSDDHWSVNDPQSIDLYQINAAPQLYCDSLPQSREYNPCRPQPNADSVLVQDYAQSLYGFVKDNGPIAIEIVTELLSPELALKSQHDELSKQGLSMREIAKRIKAAKLKQNASVPLYQATQNWDANAIIALADEIEKMNKTKLPLLPHLTRTINELDGIKGLAKFLDKDLVKEVNSVPSEIVDFAMPHGVSLATISEVLRLAMAPALQLSPNQIRCIEMLRRNAAEFISRKGPEAIAKMSGASVLSPAQLHEVQLRAQTQKRHRRAEAERQASLIVEHYRAAATSAATQPNFADKNAASGNQRLSQVLGAKVNANMQVNPQATTAAQVMQRRVSQLLPQQVTNHLPPANKNSCCKNCGTKDTLGWRAGAVGPDGVERLCIACGLYWQKSQQHRPKELWDQTAVHKQQPTGSPMGGRTPIRHTQSQSRSLTPAGSPNGVSRHSIQKRTPQSSSRRSPSSVGSRRRTPKGRAVGSVILEQSNFSQGLHAMPGLPNSIHAAAQRIQSHRNTAMQTFLEQPSSVATTSIMTTQNPQPLYEQVQRPNQIPYAGNLPSDQGATTQIQLGNTSVMNPTVFPGQQVGGLSLQQHMSNVATGAPAGVLASQKHSFGQITGSQLGSQTPNLAPNAPNVQAGQHPPAAKDISLLHGNSGINPPSMISQAHLHNVGRGGVLSHMQKAPDMRLSQAGRDPPISTQIASGPTGSIGLTPYAMQLGSLSSSGMPGFENGSVHSVANNGGIGMGPVSSEQMMESLLFGDGGLTASPQGPPEFDF